MATQPMFRRTEPATEDLGAYSRMKLAAWKRIAPQLVTKIDL
jgi:hypothetical protein